MIFQPTQSGRRINQPTIVIVNVTKWMKKHPFCGARYFINIWNIKISPPQPAPIKKGSGVYILKSQYLRRNMHHRFVSLIWFGSNPKIYLSLWGFFLLNLGTRLSKAGGKLSYYHLYHEEGSFYLEVFPRLFNRPFIVFFKSLHNI